jgi:hypothetical protein
MLALGPIAFASPWILSALLLLPLLWRLLRVIPPLPKLLRFPPIRLLLGLKPTEETPHKTPLWLLILRTAIAALVICWWSTTAGPRGATGRPVRRR